jgi:UTP--glucose-1-phosphate uridylyltransferase
MELDLRSEWGLLLERLTPAEVSSYGVIRGDQIRDGQYEIKGAVEKPSREKAPSNLGILGRYLLPPEIFPILEGLPTGALGEIQLTDAVDILAGRRPGRGFLVDGEIFDVGTPEGVREANNYFFEAPASRGPSFLP